jgi:hypothetical protein
VQPSRCPFSADTVVTVAAAADSADVEDEAESDMGADTRAGSNGDNMDTNVPLVADDSTLFHGGVRNSLHNWSFWGVNDLESKEMHVYLSPAIPPDAKRLASTGVRLAFDTKGVPEIAPTVA